MATILRLDKGDRIQVKGAFTNASGVAYDPSPVWIEMIDPDGVGESYLYGTDSEVIKLGTGIYAAEWNMLKSGTYHFRVAASGLSRGAIESYCFVKESQFA